MANTLNLCNSKKLEKWTDEGLIHHIASINKTMLDRPFCFILGSGASFGFLKLISEAILDESKLVALN